MDTDRFALRTGSKSTCKSQSHVYGFCFRRSEQNNLRGMFAQSRAAQLLRDDFHISSGLFTTLPTPTIFYDNMQTAALSARQPALRSNMASDADQRLQLPSGTSPCSTGPALCLNHNSLIVIEPSLFSLLYCFPSCNLCCCSITSLFMTD